MEGYLEEARRVFSEAEGASSGADLASGKALTHDFEKLRWFPLPSEIVTELATNTAPRCAALNK